MVYYDDEELEEHEEEPREMPEVWASEPGPCCICGKSNCRNACFRCGNPVCYHPENYMADSTCGSWIMDWWSNSAFDPDDGNEFYCKNCLQEAYGDDQSIEQVQTMEEMDTLNISEVAAAASTSIDDALGELDDCLF